MWSFVDTPTSGHNGCTLRQPKRTLQNQSWGVELAAENRTFTSSRPKCQKDSDPPKFPPSVTPQRHSHNNPAITVQTKRKHRTHLFALPRNAIRHGAMCGSGLGKKLSQEGRLSINP